MRQSLQPSLLLVEVIGEPAPGVPHGLTEIVVAVAVVAVAGPVAIAVYRSSHSSCSSSSSSISSSSSSSSSSSHAVPVMTSHFRGYGGLDVL